MQLPDECWTTAWEIMRLRYNAGLLLMCATAQAGAAAAALVVVPPSTAGRFLTVTVVANLLGLVTQGSLIQVGIRVLFATGVFCLQGHAGTGLVIFHAVLATTFLYAIPILYVFGHGQ
jgi:hypothetical protein